jgi:hypothetical protein
MIAGPRPHTEHTSRVIAPGGRPAATVAGCRGATVTYAEEPSGIGGGAVAGAVTVGARAPGEASEPPHFGHTS